MLKENTKIYFSFFPREKTQTYIVLQAISESKYICFVFYFVYGLTLHILFVYYFTIMYTYALKLLRSMS